MVTLPAPLERLLPRGGRKRATAFLSAASLYSYAMTMLAGIAVARMLAPADYAVKVLVVLIVNLGAMAVAGLPGAALKIASAETDKEAKDTVATGLLTSLLLSGAVNLILFSLALAGLFNRLYGAEMTALIGLMCLAGFVQTFSFAVNYWVSRKDYRRLYVVNFAYGTFYLLATVGLTKAFRLAGVFYALILSFAFQAAICLWDFPIPSAGALGRVGARLHAKARKLAPLATTLGVQNILAYGSQVYDKLVLGAFVAKADLAYYALAGMPIAPMLFVWNAVNQVAFPEMSRSFADRRGAALSALFRRTVKYSLATFAILGAGIAAAFVVLTKTFLVKYAPANGYLFLLLPPMILESAFTMNALSLLTAANRARDATKVRLKQLAFVVAAGFVLMALFGIRGAIAMMWSSATFAAILAYLAVKPIVSPGR